MKRSKKYKKVLKLIEKDASYKLDEALKLLPQLNIAKFVSSVDIHINLKLSDKKKKESIRGSIMLPHSVSNSYKIAVITTPEHFDEADAADSVGADDLIKKIQDGWNEFDILIATPEIMSKVAILGRLLGPKGKMPNPKNGTVTSKLKETIENYRKGKSDFKEQQGSIHKVVGKIDMTPKQLRENIISFVKAVFNEIKHRQVIPFQSVYLSPTMGPSIKLNIGPLLKDCGVE